MGDVIGIGEDDAVDRPHGVALYTAIDKCIDDIAIGNMTSFEVVGVLEVLKQRFYDDNLSSISESGLLL